MLKARGWDRDKGRDTLVLGLELELELKGRRKRARMREGRGWMVTAVVSAVLGRAAVRILVQAKGKGPANRGGGGRIWPRRSPSGRGGSLG